MEQPPQNPWSLTFPTGQATEHGLGNEFDGALSGLEVELQCDPIGAASIVAHTALSTDQSANASSCVDEYTEATYITTEFDCELFPGLDLQHDPVPEVIPSSGPVSHFVQTGATGVADYISNDLVPLSNSNLFSSAPEFLASLNPALLRAGHILGSSSGSSRYDTSSPSFTPASTQNGKDSPPESAAESERSTSDNRSKRKRKCKSEGGNTSFPSFQEMTSEFHSIPSTDTPSSITHTRSAFSPEKRKKVEEVRNMGSCATCKFQKNACSEYPRPCERCTDAAASSQLARAICIRSTLSDLRFGDFDLLFESYHRDFLRDEIKRYHGPSRIIHLALLFDENSPNKKQLTLTVQDYSASDLEDDILYHRLAADDGTFDIIRSKRYAIVPSKLPSVEDLLGWSQVDPTTTEVNPVQPFITALTKFMVTYCQIKPHLPLYDLIKSSVNILKLLHCWRSGKAVDCNSDDPKEYTPPKALISQIFRVLKEGIRLEEKFILKSLEKLIYGGGGPGENNMIPLWASLWALILTYRDCLHVYQKFQPAPRPNKSRQPGCSDYELLIDTSRRMYKALTATYAFVFRTSTPLYLDLQIKENFKFVGQNVELRTAFYKLGAEIFRFYRMNDELGTEDLLLKDMIIGPEIRARPVHLQTI